MKYSKKKKILKYILPVLLFVAAISFLIGVEVLIPARIVLVNHSESEYQLRLPAFISTKASLANDVSAVTSEMAVSVYGNQGSTYIKPSKEGEAKLTLKLFGFLKIKEVMVKVIPNTYIIPGGESIGISIKSEGLVIVDFTDFKNDKNAKCNPANAAGLKKGDMILECNGTPVTDSDDFADIVKDSSGQALNLRCIRDGISFDVAVDPVLSGEDSIYRLGAWVRDGTDGIGTMTFVDKHTQVYGAIGHGINDSDLNMLYSVGSGNALKARIVGIDIGSSGHPGELKGIFSDMNAPLGDVRLNCETGVYGKIDPGSENAAYLKEKQEMRIGMSHEIKTGKASILTTLGEDGVREYEIEIQKVHKNKVNSPKSMVIKVTDPELIRRTGGIVQGMSGSPILQDGKIVGAVTHVLVNDSTMGYGIFIESMLNNLDYVSKLKVPG